MLLRTKMTIFAQLMRREAYIYRYRIPRYVINYLLIYPFLYSVCFGYLQAQCYFGAQASKTGTLSFAGVGLIMMMITAYRSTFDLFHDLLDYKNVTYRMTLLNPKLILLQHILFGWILSFILMLPFYPTASILAGHIFDTSNTNWPMLVALLAIGCLCCVSYHLLAAIILTRPEHLSTFWFRGNFVMLVFGGAWIPHYVMQLVAPPIGYLSYVLPITYISDGLRQAIIGGEQFMPLHVCLPLLLAYSALFIGACWHMFKKRLDHL